MNASPEGLIINTYTEPRICGWCVAIWLGMPTLSVVLYGAIYLWCKS